MTTALVIMKTPQLEIEPGGEAVCELSVHNVGATVEHFVIEVLGDAAEWAIASPRELALFPNNQGDVTVTFRTPREWHVVPGPIHFGVRVVPSTDPGESAVEEGVLIVAPYQNITAEMIPQVASGRRVGKLGVAIDSRSNVAVPAIIRGRDPADVLAISVRPRQVILQPGTTTFARLKVIPRRRYLRGPQRQARFKVTVEPEHGEMVTLDATMIQRPLLPKGSLVGIGALAALALWFLLIRPAVKNEAVSAVSQPLAATQKQAQSAKAASAAANANVAKVQTKVAQQGATVSSVQNALTSTSSATTTTNFVTTTTLPATTTTAAATTTTGPTTSSNASSSSTPTTIAPTTTSPTTTTTTPTTSSASTTTTTTTVIAGAAAQLTAGAFAGATPVVASPGADQQGTLVIPAGNTLQITDLSLQNLASVAGSTVEVGVQTPSESTPTYIFEMSLITLGNENYPLNTPIVLTAGDALVVNVDCAQGAGQSCNTNVSYIGTAQVNGKDNNSGLNNTSTSSSSGSAPGGG
ncbi:MAG: hypothetical protein JWM85_2666 [Acidimicrobiaceae bacterium]|nr:hypothetical protein [Acidimicrobiaceae bacterium]